MRNFARVQPFSIDESFKDLKNKIFKNHQIINFEKNPEMTEAQHLFEELLNTIPLATAGKMFGANAIKMPNGKAGAFFKNGILIVKISGETLAEAEKLSGVKPFSPKEGYVMNRWIEIPFEHKNSWKKYAEISCAEVAKLGANKKK